MMAVLLCSAQPLHRARDLVSHAHSLSHKLWPPFPQLMRRSFPLLPTCKQVHQYTQHNIIICPVYPTHLNGSIHLYLNTLQNSLALIDSLLVVCVLMQPETIPIITPRCCCALSRCTEFLFLLSRAEEAPLSHPRSATSSRDVQKVKESEFVGMCPQRYG